MKRLVGILFLVIALCIPPCVGENNNPPDALELSIDDNLAVPSVPKKAQNYVKAAIDQLRRHLLKDGLPASLMRNDEVLCITIPCADLFAPCSVTLKAGAADKLRPLSVVVREPRKYKVLVAVHADDTGDDMYADSITEARANAIDDFLWQLAGQQDTNVIPYGIGKDDPVKPNSNRSNRAANRRVEIFIIPDDGLIQMATGRRK